MNQPSISDIYISEKLSFKRSLPKLKSQKGLAKHKFWILAWYGPSYYKKSENRIYKKVYLINSPDTTYNIENWKNNRRFELEIPEEKSFLFPFGSIFNENGLLLQMSLKQGYNKLQNIKNITINPKSHHCPKGLYSILKKTNFPVFNSSDFPVYNGASYYKIKSTDDSYTIILPIHVINAYFYYLSTTCIYHLIYNTIEKGIIPSKIIDTNPIVYYHGQLIRYQEARALAKYYFIKGNNIHPFIGSSKTFLEKSINESIHNKVYYGYFNSKIPFQEPTNIDVIGQFIKANDETLFIVYRITQANLLHSNKLFKSDQFIMINLEDKRSIQVDTPEEVIKSTRVKDKVQNIESLDELTSNHSFNIQNGIINDDVIVFSEEPESRLLDKEVQDRVFQSDNQIFREIKGLSLNHRHSDSSSLHARSNLSYNSLNQYFYTLEKALNYLTVNDRFFIDTLLINSSDGKHSIIPGRQYSNILIYSISYREQYYCIVDTGFSRIGIFKRTNSKIPFQKKDDLYIRKVVNIMAYKYDFNWSRVKQNQKLYKQETQVIAGLNHYNVETNMNEAIEKLSIKIKKYILSDQST
jgi:hypothetical protein